MNLKDFIRSIPDYPKKGILFRDITTLIKDENAFSETINLSSKESLFFLIKSKAINVVIILVIEAGYICASASNSNKILSE